ncbi:phosphate permease [Aphelenchoides avenae]|nr:phosphate permease [Aphelenchus avenae]
MIVDFAVLRRRNPVKCGLRALPIFYFVCVAFNTFVVVYGGSKYLGLDKIQLGYAFLISVAMGTFGALLFILVSRTCLMTWINRADTSPPVSITSDGAVVIGDNLSASNEAYVVTPTKSHPTEAPASKDYGVDEPRWTPKGFIKWFFPSRTRQEDPKTLRLFSSIQVFTACFAGYAHGANDVSNAIAPLAAAVSIYQNRSVAQFEQTPIWVLLFGVAAICVGLWILGSRVIKTVGQKMSEINPASGFTIEFGAAVAALVASKIGLPISTTHCLVGSVVFVGTVKSGEGIDWKIFGNIALSWIVTLPISCAISAGIMAILKLVVF